MTEFAKRLKGPVGPEFHKKPYSHGYYDNNEDGGPLPGIFEKVGQAGGAQKNKDHRIHDLIQQDPERPWRLFPRDFIRSDIPEPRSSLYFRQPIDEIRFQIGSKLLRSMAMGFGIGMAGLGNHRLRDLILPKEQTPLGERDLAF